jgi:hypothetical protein
MHRETASGPWMLVRSGIGGSLYRVPTVNSRAFEGAGSRSVRAGPRMGGLNAPV